MDRSLAWGEPTAIRVRYSDVDRMGLLYHVNYLEYFENARAAWIRNFWKPYKEIEDEGTALVVIEAHLNYIKPAHYDDVLLVSIRPTDWGRSRFIVDYMITNAETSELLCTGRTAHCFIDKSGRPTRMPDELRKRLDTHKELR
jgi:acyl-CoA thioester hydrolase